MRMNVGQKGIALASAGRYRRQLENLLVRRYWQQKKSWHLDFGGITADFATDDFYSNIWFYGSQNIGEAYEPAITQLVIEHARKSASFVDIGANLGYFSVVAGRANPALAILSVEIDETLAPILRRNLSINGVQAEIHTGAVGDGGDPIRYTPHPYSFIFKVAQEDSLAPELTLPAANMTIDAILGARKPDFVKMDVDGAEMIALRHAGAMLSNPELTMLLEVHPTLLPEFGSSAKEVGDYLTSLGFSLYTIGDFRSAAKVALERVDSLGHLSTPSGDMILVTRKPI